MFDILCDIPPFYILFRHVGSMARYIIETGVAPYLYI